MFNEKRLTKYYFVSLFCKYYGVFLVEIIDTSMKIIAKKVRSLGYAKGWIN
jgi:hypothetical protein